MEDEVLLAVSEFANSLNADRKVVADLSPLVEATSRLPLAKLEYWEHVIRWELYRALAKADPSRWTEWYWFSPFLTWIDLCSSDGYRRERTLRVLSGAAPNRFFLAMAIRRLNDWVPEVRAAAQERLLAIASESDPEDVVDVLCATLPHWNSWGRMDEDGRHILLAITAVDAVTQALKSRLLSATAGPLAAVLTQAGQIPTLDEDLPEIAASAIQPAVRAKAYKSLLDGKMAWLAGRQWKWTDKRYCRGGYKPVLSDRPLYIKAPLEETLRAASMDRSPSVRRIAADVLIRERETLGDLAFELATSLAADPYPSVVERAEFALKKLSKMREATGI